MNIYYLYVKTHKITGLKYLGYTKKKNQEKYHGSGTRWNNHLRTHGYLIDTIILRECLSKEEVREWGIHYSRLWNVVSNSEWANLKEEQGDGGGCFGEINGMFGKTHTPEVCSKLGQNASVRFKGKSYLDLYGEEKATELKRRRSQSTAGKDNSYKHNPRFDSREYCFFNVETGEMLHCNRWVFIHCNGINKGGTSDMINRGLTYKGWCVLYS